MRVRANAEQIPDREGHLGDNVGHTRDKVELAHGELDRNPGLLHLLHALLNTDLQKSLGR